MWQLIEVQDCCCCCRSWWPLPTASKQSRGTAVIDNGLNRELRTESYESANFCILYPLTALQSSAFSVSFFLRFFDHHQFAWFTSTDLMCVLLLWHRFLFLLSSTEIFICWCWRRWRKGVKMCALLHRCCRGVVVSSADHSLTRSLLVQTAAAGKCLWQSTS